MDKKSRKIIPVLSMICLCVLGAFIPAVTAMDSFAPSWLKEGAYATYICKGEGQTFVFNVSDPHFEGLNYLYASSLDEITYWNASLTWRCVSVNTTMAKLQITFDCIGKELRHYEGESLVKTPLNNESLQRTGEAYVDLYTRAVYTANGALLGTTHLWLPANPSEGQKITVWDTPSKTIALPITMNPGCKTIQGTQDTYMFADVNLKIDDAEPNSYRMILLFYDLDTGLAVDGSFSWDPIMAAAGINDSGLVGDGNPNTAISATNIDLGSEHTTINYMEIMQYSILPIAAVLLIVAFLVKRKKKRN